MLNWENILSVSVTKSDGIEIHVGWMVVAVVAILTVIYVVVRYASLKRYGTFDVVEAEVRLGQIGSVKIRPSHEEVQIAYRAWVELSTRKAALLFDEENDVITEIYDSWYELFGRMRELAKEIPAQRLRSSKDSRELVRLLVEALNGGLRPHLSRWQAKYRHWYTSRLADQRDETPQQTQRQYPQYHELVVDLRMVNRQILEYGDILKRISQG